MFCVCGYACALVVGLLHKEKRLETERDREEEREKDREEEREKINK